MRSKGGSRFCALFPVHDVAIQYTVNTIHAPKMIAEIICLGVEKCRNSGIAGIVTPQPPPRKKIVAAMKSLSVTPNLALARRT